MIICNSEEVTLIYRICTQELTRDRAGCWDWDWWCWCVDTGQTLCTLCTFGINSSSQEQGPKNHFFSLLIICHSEIKAPPTSLWGNHHSPWLSKTVKSISTGACCYALLCLLTKSAAMLFLHTIYYTALVTRAGRALEQHRIMQENFAKCHLTVVEGHSMIVWKIWGIGYMVHLFYMICRIFISMLWFDFGYFEIKPIK